VRFVEMKARAILLDKEDNVVTLTVVANKGTDVAYISDGGEALIRAEEDIPAGHKIAIRKIAKGTAAMKYGAPIGAATADIEPGRHVHTHNVASMRGTGAGHHDR